ncbi:MAG: hypothetical protein WAQ98_00455 [Blastocatellia bacterium]
MSEEAKVCDLCKRDVPNLTRHHLIPRTRHKNKKNKKIFDRKEVRERLVLLCRPCHRNIHAHLTEKQLEYDYNTVEKLLEHPEIKKFTEWISTKPDLISLRIKDANEKGK